MAKKSLTTRDINDLSFNDELNELFQIDLGLMEQAAPKATGISLESKKKDFKFALPTLVNSAIKTRFLNFNKFQNGLKTSLQKLNQNSQPVPPTVEGEITPPQQIPPKKVSTLTSEELVSLVSDTLTSTFNVNDLNTTKPVAIGNLTKLRGEHNKFFFALSNDNPYLAYSLIKNTDLPIPKTINFYNANSFANAIITSTPEETFKPLAFAKDLNIDNFFNSNPVILFLLSITPSSLLTRIFSKPTFEPLSQEQLKLFTDDEEDTSRTSKLEWVEKLSNILYADPQIFNTLKHVFESNYIVNVSSEWEKILTKPTTDFNNQISTLLLTYHNNLNPLDKDAPTTKIKPVDYLSVDESQKKAIEAALNGSVVVEGPPGAGKSNTVVNLLLNLVNNGRNVLLATKTSSALETVIQKAKELKLPLFFYSSNGEGSSQTLDVSKSKIASGAWITDEAKKQQEFGDDFFERNFSKKPPLQKASLGYVPIATVKTLVLDRPSKYNGVFNESFDNLVFDEGSQATIAEGKMVASLAKNVAIFGDTKQLKPKITSFDNAIMPKETKTSFQEYVQKNNIFPKHQLNVVYRAKASGLVNYSNVYHYANNLQTLTENSKEFLDNFSPASLHYVDGRMKEASNELEILYTIAKIINIRSKNLTNQEDFNSVIISTFNKEQAKKMKHNLNLSSDTLLEKFNAYAAKDDSGEIAEAVRNLQNHQFISFQLPSIGVYDIDSIQGKEADFVFINTVYAPDEKNKFRHNFGSLSSETDKQSARLLNVNATRAIRKTFIVTSLKPSTFDQEKLNSESKHFFDFIDYFTNQNKINKANEEKPSNSKIEELSNKLMNILGDEYELSFNEKISTENIDLVVRKKNSNVVELGFKLIHGPKEFEDFEKVNDFFKIRKYKIFALKDSTIDDDINKIVSRLSSVHKNIQNQKRQYNKIHNV